MRRANNGLVIYLAVMVAMIPMQFPAAGSADSSPDWRWDSQGRVYDASGQNRVLSREEACKLYAWGCENLPKVSPEVFTGDGGGK